ncbi:uncharacterized protein [Rutidosis leptorrhynchoides]|uniref:uncharacterized protein n=1 Tax=Rutidosis leptorrhynchoides TaxID=125765 RepID=UPI003A997773
MASGSLPPSSYNSKSEESPGDGVKSYDYIADTRWWLHLPNDNANFKIEDYEKSKEFNAVNEDTSQKTWSEDDHILISENLEKLYSETEPELIGINETGPWWRTTDLNDVDPPQTLENIIGQRIVADEGLASLDRVTKFNEFLPKSADSIGVGESHVRCDLEDDMLSNTTSDEPENTQELSKAELLEALCHSQTRAREAEIAAQQAYNEKEHMITHFLKQASHLFAYKQWLHILQLETTCLHLRNSKFQLVYTRFPDFVPWVPTKDPKRVRRKRKPGSPRYKMAKSFGRFVLGLTLVGAGLLLGWTLGWLFR